MWLLCDYAKSGTTLNSEFFNFVEPRLCHNASYVAHNSSDSLPGSIYSECSPAYVLYYNRLACFLLCYCQWSALWAVLLLFWKRPKNEETRSRVRARICQGARLYVEKQINEPFIFTMRKSAPTLYFFIPEILREIIERSLKFSIGGILFFRMTVYSEPGLPWIECSVLELNKVEEMNNNIKTIISLSLVLNFKELFPRIALEFRSTSVSMLPRIKS